MLVRQNKKKNMKYIYIYISVICNIIYLNNITMKYYIKIFQNRILYLDYSFAYYTLFQMKSISNMLVTMVVWLK